MSGRGHRSGPQEDMKKAVRELWKRVKQRSEERSVVKFIPHPKTKKEAR